VTDLDSRSLGVGHLAAVAFNPSWDRAGESAVEHLRRHAAGDGWLALAEYTYDARCLLGTALTDGQLDLLWCSCTRGNHRPGWDGVPGREWIRTVRDVTAERADPAYLARLIDAGQHPELAGRILRAAGQFHALDRFSLCEVPDDQARTALAEVVRAGYPDVALRLLLRMVQAHLMPLSAGLFDELADLARRTGLDEDIVPGLAFLVG